MCDYTMRFFGKRYPFNAYDGAERVDTPVGATCAHCGEPIVDGDDGWLVPGMPGESAFHRGCFMRGIVGSVAHQLRQCSCYVKGSECGDNPLLSKRQAADAAMSVFYGRHL